MKRAIAADLSLTSAHSDNAGSSWVARDTQGIRSGQEAAMPVAHFQIRMSAKGVAMIVRVATVLPRAQNYTALSAAETGQQHVAVNWVLRQTRSKDPKIQILVLASCLVPWLPSVAFPALSYSPRFTGCIHASRRLPHSYSNFCQLGRNSRAYLVVPANQVLLHCTIAPLTESAVLFPPHYGVRRR